MFPWWNGLTASSASDQSAKLREKPVRDSETASLHPERKSTWPSTPRQYRRNSHQFSCQLVAFRPMFTQNRNRGVLREMEIYRPCRVDNRTKQGNPQQGPCVSHFVTKGEPFLNDSTKLPTDQPGGTRSEPVRQSQQPAAKPSTNTRP